MLTFSTSFLELTSLKHCNQSDQMTNLMEWVKTNNLLLRCIEAGTAPKIRGDKKINFLAAKVKKSARVRAPF